MDTALTTVLNRYLLTALGMNPDPLDAVRKCRHLVAALPREWLQSTGNDAGAVKSDLARDQLYKNRSSRKIDSQIQSGASGEGLGWVDLDLGSSPGWWADTVATYCQSRMVEHPKSKST